jgi:hypothetical protein
MEKGIGGLPRTGDNEEKLLEYLPEVKHLQTEDEYLKVCVPILYPNYYDEQQAYSFCADKYQRKITVKNNQQTMKPTENTFEKNRINFIAAKAEADLRTNGVNLAAEGGKAFPWDECQAKMMDEYGDKDIADKVCGMIKSKYGA